MQSDNDTIVAPATAPGGALAVIRLSGPGALAVCDRLFRGRTPVAGAPSHTLHYGRIVERTGPDSTAETEGGERTVDDAVVAVFRAPHSYTGEETAEISCHGSPYIVSEILRLAIGAGARMARPGEFTQRAFLAGRMDLSQAEAVADLIASSTRTSHALASTQMRGGYSSALRQLRDRLVGLMSLLELELDFSEEDVEFADRGELCDTMRDIGAELDRLRDSFLLGNALKRGVAVAIAGAPNAGKSTLLNRLLGEERALVSEIPGTTRDTIEATLVIDGVLFRFIDTAGVRATDDRLEQMGIERTRAAVARAQIVVRLVDAARFAETGSVPEAVTAPPRSTGKAEAPHGQRILTVANKMDLHPGLALPEGILPLSARSGEGIERLRHALRNAVDTEALGHGDPVVSSARHYEALVAARTALGQALDGLDRGLPTDLLGEELRTVLHHLGTITGEITSDEILTTIFSKFCIGK